MPIGGKALHAVKGVAGDVDHHPQREANDGDKRSVAHRDRDEAEAEDRRERGDGGVERDSAVTGRRDRVDELACEDRQRHIRRRRDREGGRNPADKPGLPPPMLKGEAEDGGEGFRARAGAFAFHGVMTGAVSFRGRLPILFDDAPRTPRRNVQMIEMMRKKRLRRSASPIRRQGSPGELRSLQPRRKAIRGRGRSRT